MQSVIAFIAVLPIRERFGLGRKYWTCLEKLAEETNTRQISYNVVPLQVYSIVV